MWSGVYVSRLYRSNEDILVPVNEHGYFVASWWRTPLHHPPKVTRFYFQQTSGIHVPVGKRKGCSLSGRISAPIADSSHVATVARTHSVLNLRKIKTNNTHTTTVSVLTYYGWVSLIFSFFVVTQRNIIKNIIVIKISSLLAIVRQ
jgi:hypothetical protein